MPRRKQTAINLKKLETYPALVEELWNNPEYANKDLTSLKLTVYDNYKDVLSLQNRILPANFNYSKFSPHK